MRYYFSNIIGDKNEPGYNYFFSIVYLKLISLFLIMFLFSCKSHSVIPADTKEFSVFISDTCLKMTNGQWFYKNNQLFNGELKENWPNGNLKNIQQIRNGKQQGLSETFYANGSKESVRWYLNGEKDSVHTGWWENGNKKFEYHFKHAVYDGLFSEWYQNGSMLQQLMYTNGKEMWGKGWRENGKLYMNYTMKDGRRYGLYNSNLCYGLKDENVIK